MAKGPNGKAIISVTALLMSATSAGAATPAITLSADAPLRYGAFVVFTSGSRTVSATGAVSNVSISPVGAAPVGPAQFTVAYDRGNQSSKPITVVMQVVLSSVPQVSQGGVTGRLSAFDSDLPGAVSLVPGQAVSYTIANCTSRVCARTFRIGARLDVTRSTGGAALSIQLPVLATLISVDQP